MNCVWPTRAFCHQKYLVCLMHFQESKTRQDRSSLSSLMNGMCLFVMRQLIKSTGRLLPIKKEKTQSALNNFDEFPMLSAGNLAPYVGFTEEEVQKLAEEYHQDFNEVKRWYDGYLLKDYQVYNPRAVVSVMLRGEFKSYWSETASYDAIVPLINMNYDGLKTAIIEMLSGAEVKVNTATFKNDTVNIKNKDDVLTYMIHLGYLGYNENKKTAFVPNEEIRQELTVAVESKLR